MKSWHKIIIVIISIGIGFLLVWEAPKYLIDDQISKILSPKEIISIENEYRRIGLQIFGGAFLLFGLYLTYRRIKSMEESVKVANESHFTDRFSRAVELLGSEKIEVRLGGIYALERLAKDSLKDHFSIMEILSAFVRDNCPLDDTQDDDVVSEQAQILDLIDKKSIGPRADIQAVLTVIGRRNWINEEINHDFHINLGLTNLEGANLWNANLQGVHFWSANLHRANLMRANLTKALLMRTNLNETFLEGAIFNGANLRSAKMESVITVEVEKLARCSTLYMAKLDEPIREKIRGLNPRLLEDTET